MTHRGQAPWGVLPSAMQSVQPISLVRSLCAFFEHRVAGSSVVVIGDTGPQRARLPARGVVRLSRGAMTHRGQAAWDVLPSAMQREQSISLVRSLSASIEHRVAGWRGGHRRQADSKSKAAHAFGVVRLSRGAMTHRGQASLHLGRAAECHAT